MCQRRRTRSGNVSYQSLLKVCCEALLSGQPVSWSSIKQGLKAEQRQRFHRELALAVALACNDLYH